MDEHHGILRRTAKELSRRAQSRDFYSEGGFQLFCKTLRTVNSTLRAAGDVIVQDASWLASIKSLEARFQEIRHLSLEHVGIAAAELKRYVSDSERGKRRLETIKSLSETNSSIAEIRSIIERAEARLAFFAGVKNNVEVADKEADSLDARLIFLNPHLASRYEQLPSLLQSAKESLKRGDFLAAHGLQQRIRREVEYIKYEANRTQRHASEEIAVWREHMQSEATCLPHSFSEKLDKFSEPVSTDDVPRWHKLRLEMEAPIQQLAANTRNENKAAGKRRDSSLRIDILDADLEALERFSKAVTRKYKQAFRQSA